MDQVELAAVPLFSMLDEARLAWLATECPPRDLSRGATAARVGEPARHLVVVIRGTLSAGYDTSHGSRVRFVTVTGPCVIDKAAVLGGGSHTATWTASTACRIRLLPAVLLRDLIGQVPALRDHVLRHLSDQVHRDRRAQVRRAAPQPVTRVAAWVAESMRTRGSRITLPGAQQGLGEEIGLSRVTVNRALQVLVGAGAIRVEPGAIVVLDPSRLTARDGS
ncbi:Crp/Fnr family transcriptional regulator [Micromonospora sediminimaris]|nr:Crp/Fnr family transcriptional regulator [Micromonospora sediminimaris]SFB95500.1 cAMP-binding domain of CRP or a regulatory subunit of cAMP-dependent protein kinases [Micromonospora sediminimaris]